MCCILVLICIIKPKIGVLVQKFKQHFIIQCTVGTNKMWSLYMLSWLYTGGLFNMESTKYTPGYLQNVVFYTGGL